jgi:hypothetical protein
MSKGFTKDEYNAMLHAIWHFDRLVAECLDNDEQEEEYRTRLERDRKALSDLFVRLG